jgi:hypothetical protein
MSNRHCLLSLAILTLSSHPALLGAQGTPAPAERMAVRWNDSGGRHTGTITTIMPDGSFVVDLLDPDGHPLKLVVALDPRTTPTLEVRVAHASHRTLGAVVGGAAGLMGAMVAVASKSPCSLFDNGFGSCVGGRVALVLGGTGAGAAVGAVLAGESSTWVPARSRPANEPTGPTVRPFLTWHDGPAVGLKVRF